MERKGIGEHSCKSREDVKKEKTSCQRFCLEQGDWEGGLERGARERQVGKRVSMEVKLEILREGRGGRKPLREHARFHRELLGVGTINGEDELVGAPNQVKEACLEQRDTME